LESDSQAQAKPAQVNLAGLTLQKVQARGVLVLEVLVLGIKKLRLLAQELDCLSRNFGIVARKLGGHSRRERFRTSERL
jgi:hypothetical protein